MKLVHFLLLQSDQFIQHGSFRGAHAAPCPHVRVINHDDTVDGQVSARQGIREGPISKVPNQRLYIVAGAVKLDDAVVRHAI